MRCASANALVAVISITALWGTVRAGEDRSSAGLHGGQLHRSDRSLAQAGSARAHRLARRPAHGGDRRVGHGARLGRIRAGAGLAAGVGRLLRAAPARSRARFSRDPDRACRRGRRALRSNGRGCYGGGELVLLGDATRRLDARGSRAARVRPPRRGEPVEPALAGGRVGNQALGERRADLLSRRGRHRVPRRRGRPLPAQPRRGLRGVLPRPGRAEGRRAARDLGSRRRQLLPRGGRAAGRRAGRPDALGGPDDDPPARPLPRGRHAPLGRDRADAARR